MIDSKPISSIRPGDVLVDKDDFLFEVTKVTKLENYRFKIEVDDGHVTTKIKPIIAKGNRFLRIYVKDADHVQ